MVMAGASAVEVGTATFANPRAPWLVAARRARVDARHAVRVDRRTARSRPWLRRSANAYRNASGPSVRCAWASTRRRHCSTSWGRPDIGRGPRVHGAGGPGGEHRLGRRDQAPGGLLRALRFRGYRVLERLISRRARRRDPGDRRRQARRHRRRRTTRYAEAWLDEASPLCSDAVTVSPYTGVAALTPFFDARRARTGGLRPGGDLE